MVGQIPRPTGRLETNFDRFDRNGPQNLRGAGFRNLTDIIQVFYLRHQWFTSTMVEKILADMRRREQIKPPAGQRNGFIN